MTEETKSLVENTSRREKPALSASSHPPLLRADVQHWKGKVNTLKNAALRVVTASSNSTLISA